MTPKLRCGGNRRIAILYLGPQLPAKELELFTGRAVMCFMQQLFFCLQLCTHREIHSLEKSK